MKILMVLTSHGSLITGQNPASSTITAQAIMNFMAAEKAA